MALTILCVKQNSLFNRETIQQKQRIQRMGTTFQMVLYAICHFFIYLCIKYIGNGTIYGHY